MLVCVGTQSSNSSLLNVLGRSATAVMDAFFCSGTDHQQQQQPFLLTEATIYLLRMLWGELMQRLPDASYVAETLLPAFGFIVGILILFHSLCVETTTVVIVKSEAPAPVAASVPFAPSSESPPTAAAADNTMTTTPPSEARRGSIELIVGPM